jgi:hypothetical protein
MRTLALAVFWVTGTLLYLAGLLFGLQVWGLAGLIAFAAIPPLEFALPFVAWVVTGVFPVVLFGLWAAQIIAVLIWVAREFQEA